MMYVHAQCMSVCCVLYAHSALAVAAIPDTWPSLLDALGHDAFQLAHRGL